MRITPRLLAGVILLWGCLGSWLLARSPAGGCPLGSCPACGACLPPPAVEQPCAEEDRIA